MTEENEEPTTPRTTEEILKMLKLSDEEKDWLKKHYVPCTLIYSVEEGYGQRLVMNTAEKVDTTPPKIKFIDELPCVMPVIPVVDDNGNLTRMPNLNITCIKNKLMAIEGFTILRFHLEKRERFFINQGMKWDSGVVIFEDLTVGPHTGLTDQSIAGRFRIGFALRESDPDNRMERDLPPGHGGLVGWAFIPVLSVVADPLTPGELKFYSVPPSELMDDSIP